MSYSQPTDDMNFGMDKDLAAKMAGKHDAGAEAQARAWVEAVIGESLGDGSLHEVLKSGVALCNLVNVISPGLVPKPSTAKMPFKQMENIGNYLSGCTNLGLKAHDSFQTVDLYEGANMVQVVTQIHRLGSVVAARGWSGPTLGVKTATANEREFTEEQKRAGAAAQTFLGAGSTGTAAADMKTSELLGSQIAKMTVVEEGKSGGGGGGIWGGGGAVDISDQVKAHAAASAVTPQATLAPVGQAAAALPPSANPMAAAAAKTPASGNATGSYAAASAASDMPSSGKNSYLSAADRDANMAANGGKLLYGMDKELAEKQAAKWDPKLEAEARAWIEAVTGETLDADLHAALKSGIVLVNLVNAIQPGILKPPSKMSAPFKQMENIGNYLSACTKLGVPAHDSFQTVDLYENANLLQVVIQIHRLGSVASKVPGFKGPGLGVKTADANKREFTAEQIAAGKAEQTFLGKGSHGTAGGNMSKVDAGQAMKFKGGEHAGGNLGKGGEQTMIGTGSHGTAGGNMAKTDMGQAMKFAGGDFAGGDFGKGGEQTFVGTGSHGTAGGNMSKADEGQAMKFKGGDYAGGDFGKGNDQTFVGTGSHGTAGAQMNTAEHLGNNIVKTSQ